MTQLMAQFRELERQLSAATDSAARWALAAQLCAVEAQISHAHNGRTLAWIPNRDPAWYAERGGDFQWRITRVPIYTQMQAAA